jgi:hypothetical protein
MPTGPRRPSSATEPHRSRRRSLRLIRQSQSRDPQVVSSVVTEGPPVLRAFPSLLTGAIGSAPRRRESSVDEESTRGCRLLHLETFPPVPVIQTPGTTRQSRSRVSSARAIAPRTASAPEAFPLVHPEQEIEADVLGQLSDTAIELEGRVVLRRTPGEFRC